MTNYLKELSRSVKNWWMFIIYGIALIACGVFVFTTPVESYVSLTIMFSALVLVNGIVQSVFSIQNRKTLRDWDWQLAGGILEIALGIFLAVYPGITFITLPYMVAFWLIIRAAYTMSGANEMRKLHLKGYGWLIATGVLQIVLAGLVLFNPMFGMMYLVVFTALALINMGAAHIYIGVKLKAIKKETLDKVSSLIARYKKEVKKAKNSFKEDIKDIRGQIA